jgi:hypothetical protein
VESIRTPPADRQSCRARQLRSSLCFSLQNVAGCAGARELRGSLHDRFRPKAAVGACALDLANKNEIDLREAQINVLEAQIQPLQQLADLVIVLRPVAATGVNRELVAVKRGE